MFGKPSIVKEYAGLIKQLENGERRPAQHVRPNSLCNRLKSFVTGGAEAIFEEFDYSAAVLNQHVADPWTVEERPGVALHAASQAERGSSRPHFSQRLDLLLTPKLSFAA